MRYSFALIGCLISPTVAANPTEIGASTHAQDLLGNEAQVFTDGSGHYLFMQMRPNSPVYFGDQTAAYAQTQLQFASSVDDRSWDRVFWAPQSPAHAQLAVENLNAVSITCFGRKTAFQPLHEAKARDVLAKVALRPVRFQREPLVLARDRKGVYYFADRIKGGSGIRLFAGKKGALRELRLVDVASDTSGLVLESKRGTLSVDLTKNMAEWTLKAKTQPLSLLPLDANRVLVFAELGVYREKLGVPCDEL